VWEAAWARLVELRVCGGYLLNAAAPVALFYRAAIQAARGQPSALSVPAAAPTEEEPDPILLAATDAAQAAVARTAGDRAGAARLSERALDLSVRASGIDDDFPIFWVSAVEDQLEIGQTERARTMLTPVGQAPRGLVPTLQAALLPWLRARIDIVAGTDDTVAVDLHTAETKLRQFGARFYLARALLDHAEWLDQRGDVAAAMPLAAEALDLFTALRAAAWAPRAARVAGAEVTPVAPGGT
jgi:hypothetical protein